MAIRALPPSAIRTLASSQVISTPESVVKELIDNAIDARATVISIELSANLLDVIQVRDNGHGVSANDRPLLCRRHCTSKIRDLSDLKFIGPESLGFRGDALASTAELASTLTITTRVQGEQVATKLIVDRTGEVVGQTKASHPIGTTVRVEDFLAHLPVRKQTTLKSCTCHLHAIHKLLQAYAFTRLSIRISLRILGAPGEKSNWTYVPMVKATIEDAAFKIVGRECANSCQWTVHEAQGYKLRAFLPKPGVLPKTISGQGSFISVDSRPVSHRKGILKQVMLLYRDHLRTSSDALQDVKDPFLWLSISCPCESYDVNIEPAKDAVLFADGDIILAAMRALLETAYLTPPRRVSNVSPASLGATASMQPINCKQSEPEMPNKQLPLQRQIESHHNARTHYSANTPTEHDIEDENLCNVGLSNPWILAKMTASTCNRQTQQQDMDTPMLAASPLQELRETRINSEASVTNDLINCGSGPLPTTNLPSLPEKAACHERSWHEIAQSSRGLASSDNGRSIANSEPFPNNGTRGNKTITNQQPASVIFTKSAALPQYHDALPAVAGAEPDLRKNVQSFTVKPRHGRVSLARPNKAFKIPSRVTRSLLATELQAYPRLPALRSDQDISRTFTSLDNERHDRIAQPPSLTFELDNPCNRPIQPNGSVLDATLFEEEYDLMSNMSPARLLDSEQAGAPMSSSTRIRSFQADPVSPDQHLQHVIHAVSVSYKYLSDLATQLEDLNISLASIDLDPWAHSLTSSLREFPPGEAELQSWSSRLESLLEQRNVDCGPPLDQLKLREQIKTSLIQLQASA